MEGLLTKLAEVLEQESKVYGDMLDISRHKTEVIVEGKVAELDCLTEVEQKLVVNIGRLEQQREKLSEEIAGCIGVDGQQVSIEFIIEKSNGGLKNRFEALRDDISATLKELKEVNALNSDLVRKSLEYIDFSLNLITGSVADGTYDVKKGKHKKEGISFFDQKV